jgi:peptide/nickel transport system substrate-binding protein
MSYAFDHDEMLNTLWFGLYEPSNGLFHRTAWMAPKNPPKPFKQDLDKAEDLLDQAGWEDHDGDGIRDKEINGRTVPFDFTIQCGELPESVAVCELLKNNLAQIGVTCHVKPTEFTVLQQNNFDHTFQATFGGFSTGTDPSTTENIFGSGEDRNYVQYSNPEVDKLYKQGLREFDRQKRAAIYGRIHEILYADQPFTWLYFRNSFYGFNKKVRGVVYSSRGPHRYSPGFFSIWSAAQ